MTCEQRDRSETGLEIAVIGMAGRFPGAGTIKEFWDNLKNGVESITFFSDEELKHAGIGADLLNHPNYVKAKGMIKDVEYFDADFFEYSPADAKVMDPQMRLFHECVWEALENAGYNPYTYKGSIGLYTGASGNIQWEALCLLSLASDDTASQFNVSELCSRDFISTRVSYKLNLRGPSMLIQTACSSSLAAVHTACHKLLAGGCDIAIAGGVSVSLPQKSGYVYQDGMVLSHDGHCRAFDEQANGTVVGEGAGVVVLKRLEDAVADGDTILAVIKGSEINNDGSEKIGYTAPSIEGQSQAIEAAYHLAEVDPETVSYIEAHGTGTHLGDPVEIKALKEAFNTSKRNYCAIGSVKTNIGHLDAAAGVAGLIKTVLSLKNRQIPPSLHYTSPNPKIDFGNSPFYVNNTLRDWVSEGHPLRAGVSSFGIGGTNVHVVLEEAPGQEKEEAGREYQMMVLSAKTPTALDRMSQNLSEYLAGNPDICLADAAYTLQVGRAEFKYRRAIAASSITEAIQQLAKPYDAEYVQRDRRKVVFMFPGQGSQYTHMGMELYEKEPVFREEMDRCFHILKPMIPFDIKKVLYPKDNEGDIKITDTLVTQPLIFSFEYSLAKLLMSIGIKPHVMIGHSLGEYTAACLAGVFSLEDALSLVVERGKLMQQLPEGAMLSVPLTQEELRPFLTEGLALAAVNSTSLCVVSGSKAAVADLEERLWKQGCQAIKLPASKAFHSKGMEPVIEAFAQKMKGMKLGNPQIPYLSNVTGRWITAEEATSPAYWGRHLSETVRFAEGMAEILKDERAIFLEVGPGWTLTASTKQHKDYGAEHVAVNLIRYEQEAVADSPFQQLMSSMIKKSQMETGDEAYLFNQLGKLWCAGLTINWELLHKDGKRRRIPLPTYPFERQRYWMDGNLFEELKHRTVGSGFKEIERTDRDEWLYIPSWKRIAAPQKRASDGCKSCVVFINDNPFVETITHRLKQEFNELFAIKAGCKYAKESDHCYEINPCEKEDYRKVLYDLKKKGHSPELMVHLWNVTGDIPSCISQETVKKRQEEGFYSLMYLTQAVSKNNDIKNVEIIVVSDHLQDITGEAVDYSKSAIPGACKVINQECSNVHCRSIDIEIPAPGTTNETRLLDNLIIESRAKENEAVIAYRNNRRWAPTFELVSPDAVEESAEIKLREKGVYLITGGLGNIGFVFADYLVRKYSAKIALLSRSEFLPKKEWEQWLDSHDADNTTSKRIRKIKELEALGGEVLVCKADLSDPVQLLDTVNAIEETLGKINGVFHAAGVVAAHLLSEITREDCEEYFQAKIYGLLGLYEVFKNKEIDFCMLMSSLSPILGGLGFLAYAASNSFMDAFAAGLEENKNWFSINWEGWSFHENTFVGGPIGKEEAGLSLRPSEGLAVFEHLLKLPRTNQMIVSTGSLHERYKKWVLLKKDKKPEGTKNEKAKPSIPRPNLTTPYVALQGETEERLAALWQEILGYNGIGREDNFFDLGGNSLMAIMLVSKIHKEFNISMPLGNAFKTPTIAQMSRFIEEANSSSYLSIPKAEMREYYPMSAAQKRLYILDRIEEVGTAYNMPFRMNMEGDMGRERFEKAFCELVKRHEAFRTSFHMIEGEPVQKIHEEIEFSVIYREISEDQIKDLEKEFVKAFDLSKAPLLRVCLAKTGARKHVVMVDMHHIITDGVSLGIIVQDFMKAYKGVEWKPKGLEYKDYSLWQKELLAGDGIKEQEEYWLDTLKGDLPVLNMPYDYPRPSVQSFEGDTVEFIAGREVTQKLHDLAKEKGTTLYMVLLAVFNVLLCKYTGQEDIVIGCPVAGRPHEDLQDIVGLFVNTLVMRNYPAGSKTFNVFLDEVKENSLRAYENQDYQFEELVEKLNFKRDLSRNPLFDVEFVLQNTYAEEVSIEGLELKHCVLNTVVSKFDITLNAVEADGSIGFKLEYCTKLFKKETIERLAGHFINILESISDKPHTKLCDVEMLSKEEKEHLLIEFNNTHAEYPKDKTLAEMFEAQVRRTPDRIAVVFEDRHLTYRQLNEKANRLARVLRAKGVKPDSIVGIMVERSPEMMVGIMGIMKAGGAYLPIDPKNPADRISYLLEDSGAKLLLIQDRLTKEISFDGEILALDNESLYQGDGSNLENCASPHSLAYVIYTSGSTGKPKGAMIENYSVVNRIHWMQKQYPIGKGDVILQKTPYTFDVSVWELFWWSFTGAAVCLLVPDGEKNPEEIVKAIEKNKVTTLHFVPSMLSLFLEYMEQQGSIGRLESLKQVFASGEALHLKQVEKFNEMLYKTIGVELHNLYGPTEATVDVSYFGCSTDEAVKVIPIGKPIDNIQLYVVGKGNSLQPVGVAGELCIAGDGLARGYLNRPALTAEKFVENPFVPGTRMYRTGDLARWLPDGNIEFLGRIDHQVKIRGFRIELGEIEIQLLKHGFIKEAVVVAREDKSGSKNLCAYIVSEGELTVGEMREYLSRELPEYMIPSYFIQLDKMPLNANGKVDRKALPQPDGSIKTGKEYEAPRNRLEEELVTIWKDLLQVDGIGINDNFFELGGHSLKAMLLVQKIHKEYHVELPLREVFNSSTIKELANYIKNTEKSVYASIRPLEEKEFYPVSSAQKRLYLIHLIEGQNASYNMPAVMEIRGPLDKRRFEEAFKKLIERHESLRTSFQVVDGEPVQKLHPSVNFTISCLEGEEKDVEAAIKEFVKPFDLDQAPLLRVGLIKFLEDRHILIYDMHHIISDGISMNIIIKEFISIYNGELLPEVKVQYKDFSAWQNRMLEMDTMKKQKEHWLHVFSGEIPVLNMPTDYPRPSVQRFEGSSIRFEIDKALAEGLAGISSKTGTTLYMVLLAAYNILLSKYSGQEDIVVGSTIAGRQHPDLENVVGMFVNTLAMRNYPEGAKTFAKFLHEVKENSLEAYENQDYQFEKLVDDLDIRRDLSRNPLFDAMFVLQNMEMGQLSINGLEFSPYKFDWAVSKFDLTLTAAEVNEKIVFDLEYSTKLFKKETMERMAGHYINILGAVIGNSEIELCEIDMMSEAEKRQVLKDFNGTNADYPKDKTLHQLFEEQVEKTPEHIAVVFEDRQLTYRELNARANQLARVLRGKGVQPDSIVAIMAERSLEMIVGIMAILKSGGAYLPIGPEYPKERIQYMLEDSGANILLMQRQTRQKAEYAGTLLEIDDETLYAGNDSNLDMINTPGNLAYIIYTSGTTDKPKGAMIEHKNVVRLMMNDKMQFDFTPTDTWTMFHSYSFDFSVWEMYGALLYGGKLIIVPKMVAKDSSEYVKLLQKEQVTILNQTPSAFYGLAEEEIQHPAPLLQLRYVIFGGEALQPIKLKSFKERYPSTKLINMYGITETTVHVTYKEITLEEIEANISNIGVPIPTLKTYVMDKNMKLLPVGVAGELCVAGDGVARGYLNKPELTSSKFVMNPYSEKERMYKSGDLVKLLANGEMEYLGRIDHQVKIRGFRVELGEIEAALRKYPSIKEAVVFARSQKNEETIKRLVAYMVPQGNEKLEDRLIRNFLREKLPDYMIPSLFIVMEAVPLTANGKIDTRALHELEREKSELQESFTAPQTEAEKQLAEIWQEVLEVGPVGIDDNFFDIGGDSILSIKVVAQAKKHGFDLSVEQLFQHVTIRELAQRMRRADPPEDREVISQAFSMLSPEDRALFFKKDR